METSLTSPDTDPATIVSKPSLKQRWLKRLKRLGWAAVWLCSLIALFYAIENWRGRRAWNTYVAKVNARGDSVAPAAVIPPPVPDAENFALSPMFQEAFAARYALDAAHKGGSRTTPQPQWPAKAEQDLKRIIDFGPKKRMPAGSLWPRGEFVDLAAWQDFLRTGPEVSQTPAENVLQSLSGFDGYLQELHAIKDRPYSRFPIRYEDAPVIIAPHYTLLTLLTRLSSLRATARLAVEDREGAFEDLLLAFRVLDSAGGDPLIISALIRQAYLHWPVQPLWEGMMRAEWTDEQLASFEQRLATMNLVKHFHDAARADRNLCILPYLDSFRENSKGLLDDPGWRHNLRPSVEKMLGTWMSDPVISTSLDEITEVILRVAPAGWYDQNKVAAGEWIDRVVACMDSIAKRVHPDRVRALQEEHSRAKKAKPSPYEFLEQPDCSQALIRLANMQGNLGLARIAIALERHRLRHGELPETLSGLEPDVVPTGGIPHDPATGTAPHYKRLSSGRFTLYFDGWNGKDDGGTLGTQGDGPGKPRLDPTKGDWVWPVPSQPVDVAR